MTDRQRDYIQALQREKRLSVADLLVFTEGVPVDALDKRQASALLDLLTKTSAGELGRMAKKAHGQLELA